MMKITKVFGVMFVGAQLSGEERLSVAENSAKNAENSGANFDSRLTEKRYHQLITQMNFYNQNFDPRNGFYFFECHKML